MRLFTNNVVCKSFSQIDWFRLASSGVEVVSDFSDLRDGDLFFEPRNNRIKVIVYCAVNELIPYGTCVNICSNKEELIDYLCSVSLSESNENNI